MQVKIAHTQFAIPLVFVFYVEKDAENFEETVGFPLQRPVLDEFDCWTCMVKGAPTELINFLLKDLSEEQKTNFKKSQEIIFFKTDGDKLSSINRSLLEAFLTNLWEQKQHDQSKDQSFEENAVAKQTYCWWLAVQNSGATLQQGEQFIRKFYQHGPCEDRSMCNAISKSIAWSDKIPVHRTM